MSDYNPGRAFESMFAYILLGELGLEFEQYLPITGDAEWKRKD